MNKINPVKISIHGEFWDCQAYGGNLYLWTLSDELLIISWDEILSKLKNSDGHDFFLNCAFYDSRFPYELKYKNADKNKNLTASLVDGFNDLSKKKIEIELKDIKYTKSKNAFDEPPTDTEILNGKMYGTTASGFYVKSSSDKKSKKIWDCSLLSLKANGVRNGRISLSAGSDGLYQLGVSNKYKYQLKVIEEKSNIFQISKKHSMSSDWMYQHVFSSSNVDDSLMAKFNINEDEDDDTLATSKVPNLKKNEIEKKTLKIDKLVSANKLFHSSKIKNSISWGAGDKIYRTNSKGLSLVIYNRFFDFDPKNKEVEFSEAKSIKIDNWGGSILSGGNSYFGTVVELEEKLLVLLSNNTSFSINGPVVRWRLYPRSLRFQNQMHIILNDKLEIYSFNHDFLVEQNNKVYGIKQDYRYRQFLKNAD